MQHVINIAFDFDDDKVKSIAENAVKNEIEMIIKGIVLDELAPSKRDYLTGRMERNWEKLYLTVDESVDEFLRMHKEEIIERAADKLIKSIRNSKAWKEKRSKALEAEDE